MTRSGPKCEAERLHIWPHDVSDPAQLGRAPELVHGGLLLTVGAAKRLKRCFHSDLRPKLEAVCNCLRRAIDAQLSPIHRMRFDTELEWGFREVDDADGRIVQLWGPGTSLDGKPNLEGVFGSQFVESECRGEA